MPVISVTRLHVRAWRHIPSVLAATLAAAWQARTARGNLAVSVLCATRDTYWTRTVWQDEASMMAYVHAGVHRRIMGRLLRWCDESSVVHWCDSGARLPAWDEAHRRLSEDGRHFPPGEPGLPPAFALPRRRFWRELRIR